MLPYAVSVPTRMPPGRHEVRVTWECQGKSAPERIFTFDVANPDFGKPVSDSDVDSMRSRFPGATVVVLQQGQPCAEFGLTAYEGCSDAFIMKREEDRASNTGGKDFLKVGLHADDNRALIRFDLSALAKGARIEAAALKLRMDSEGHANGKYAYRVLRDWSAGTGRIEALRPDGTISEGINPGARAGRKGECTWNGASLPENWGVPGCDQPGVDREAEPLCVGAAPGKGRARKVWVSWDITAAARAWAGKPESNHGVLLAVDLAKQSNWEEKCGVTHATLRSADYFDPPMRPKLILAFTK